MKKFALAATAVSGLAAAVIGLAAPAAAAPTGPCDAQQTHEIVRLGRGLDALLSWWAVGVRFAGYRAGDVADVIDILRGGGAEVTGRHRELAAAAGASQVEAALRR
jgi:hypothetical protein